MNKFILIVASFCIFAFANTATAQTKEQEKAYREELKRIKQMTPSEIKALMVKLDKKTRESEECDTQNEQLKQALSEKEQEIGELRASQLAQAAEKEAAAPPQVAVTTTPAATPPAAGTPAATATTTQPVRTAAPMPTGSFEQPAGVYFRIQLAAERGNIEEVVSQELFVEQENGYSKLLKGVFYNLDDARKARNYFKRIGVHGAWIVGYENGTRIPVSDAVRKAATGTAASK
jgi:hypothetical protein